MNTLSITVTIVAYICLYSFLFYLIIFVKTKQFYLLWFSLLCLSIAIYDFGAAGLYSATNFTEGVFWQRLQLADLNLVTICFLWFFWTFFKLKKKIFAYIWTMIFLIFLVLGVVIPTSVTLKTQIPRVLVLGDLFQITIFEGSFRLLYGIQVILIFIGIVSLFIYAFTNRQMQFKTNIDKNTFLISFFLFALSITNDILIGLGVYTFIYTVEYAYLIIVLFMTHIFLNHYTQMFYDTKNMNIALERNVKKRTIELEKKSSEINTLNRLLPICASCKKIRDDKNYWNEVDLYISRHSESRFSHGMCMECAEKLYGEKDWFKNLEKR